MRNIIIYIISTILWAEVSVDVTVDQKRIIEGESITLTVTANNAPGIPEVLLPNISNFKVVSGPNQSSSSNIQYLNGNMTKSTTTTLSWSLIPIKIGRIMIPSLSIKLNQKTFTSNPIEITVSKRKNPQNNSGSRYFLEAKVNNNNPFRGEQIILTYTLFTQVDITSFDEDLPKYKGFWMKELYSPKKLNLREVQKNGMRYYAGTIKKLVLFPTKSAEIVLEPMTAVIGIREKQQRWNDFSIFGPPAKKITIATNELIINVMPLPINTDGNMSALVGDWNIKSSVSSKNVKQDEAVIFNVIISGTGNLQSVDVSDIYFPNELEVFDPEILVTENLLADHIGGEKHFKWVLIPRHSGDIYIPKYDFIYFDPKTEKWINKFSPQYHLQVSANEKIAVSRVGLSKQEIALVGKDIRFINLQPPKWKNREHKLLTNTGLTLLLLASIIFAFPYAHSITKDKLDQSFDSRKAQLALKSALKILDLKTDLPEEIYTQLYKAVVTYINHKTGASKVEYTKTELIEILKFHKLDKVCARLENILSRSEAVRFAQVSFHDAHADINKMKQLLIAIDHDWN